MGQERGPILRDFGMLVANFRTILGRIEGEKVVEVGEDTINIGLGDNEINEPSVEDVKDLELCLLELNSDTSRAIITELEEEARKALENDIMRAGLYISKFKK